MAKSGILLIFFLPNSGAGRQQFVEGFRREIGMEGLSDTSIFCLHFNIWILSLFINFIIQFRNSVRRDCDIVFIKKKFSYFLSLLNLKEVKVIFLCYVVLPFLFELSELVKDVALLFLKSRSHLDLI